MTESPVACPRCGLAWDFGTDWLGRLAVLHPVGRCIPKPVPTFEEDEEEANIEVRCDECHKPFRPKKHAGGSQIVCGSKCRSARRDRKHKESELRLGATWAIRNKKRAEMKKLGPVGRWKKARRVA